MAAYTLPKLCQNMACFAYMIDEAKYLMDIGNNIRTRRNDLGVSQQELADNSDIAKSTVQRIEKGELNHEKIDFLTQQYATNIIS